MSKKSNAFINNLKLHLGINDFNEITEKHAAEILKYVKMHGDVSILKDLVKLIPDFLSFAKAANKEMNNTFREITKAGISDTNNLKEIIMQLNRILESDDITEKDKERVFDLITGFQNILKDQLDKNHKLRELQTKGLISLGFLAFGISFFVAYKALGGKGGEEVFTKSSQKMIE